MSINAGTILAGKYRLESLVGRGGMGSVWRAEHLGLSAPVAVKLLDAPGFSNSAESLARFHREARAAATIRSPHVVQIFDHGVDETLATPFIVMELMEGESLAQRLAHSGSIGAAEVARVFTQVARALGRAHEAGIVHRDLKPDNVFLVRNEDEEVAKVLDFGIAKLQAHGLGTDSATATGAVMGTAYYMSPEQISGAKNVDFRTDLWAFGVMACECLTGTRPFDADTIGGLTLRICIEPLPVPSNFGAVPAGFDAWFARSVSRDPGARFASAREAVEALRLVCGGRGAPLLSPAPVASAESSGAVRATSATTAGPLSVSSRGVTKRASWSGKVWLALLSALVGLAVVAFVWWNKGASRAVAAHAVASASAPSAEVTGQASPTAAPPAVPSAASVVTPAGPVVIAASAVSSVVREPVAAPVAAMKPAPRRPVPAAVVPPAPPQPNVAVPVAPAPPATHNAAAKAPVRDVIDDRH